MTREEAIGYLKGADVTVGREPKTKTAEALEMAIKALEKAPCEYAVDREQVNDILGHCIHNQEDYYLAIKMLNELPPVTPQTKIGWWITEKVDGGRKVYCSKCEGSAVFEYVHDGDIYSSYGHGVVKKTKYCPNCGTKMIPEPYKSESENK